jgi:hypothetical protein
MKTTYCNIEVDPFADEKQTLGKTLKKFPMLFGGGLGMFNIKTVNLELIDGAKPYHARPFSVPQSLELTKKTEIKRLTDIDVFNRSSYSEWAAPKFIQAKKTGDVRILTDVRRLNAQIKRKTFPLPRTRSRRYKSRSSLHGKGNDPSKQQTTTVIVGRMATRWQNRTRARHAT